MRALSICLAIALAVSVLLAIVYSSRAAVSSFERIVGVFSTERNALIRAPYGKDLSIIAPKLLPYLATHADLVVGSEYLVSLIEGERYRDISLLALDMLASLEGSAQVAGTDTTQMNVFASARTRKELNLPGTLKLAINDRIATFKLHELADSQSVSDGVLLIDIATADRLLGSEFKLQFAAIDITPQELDRIAPEIRRLAPTCTIEAARSRTSNAKTLYSAFELNIKMMVLVAFIVTIFTIYTSALLAATRRQREVGILRTLGFQSHQILIQLLSEAILIGAIGGALGAVLGQPLTQWAARSILQAASSLYSSGSALFAPTVNSFWIDLPFAIGAGVVTALLGFLVPTLRSAAEPPALSSRRRVELQGNSSAIGWLAMCSIVLVLLLDYCARSMSEVVLAYLAAMFVFVAIVMIARPALNVLIRLLPRRGMRLMVARSLVQLNLRASAVAVVAGASAVTLLVGLGVLIESFDHSLSRWMTTTLQADVYLRAATMHDSTRPVRLSSDVIEWLRTRPEVSEALFSSTIAQEVDRYALRLEGTQLQRALELGKYQIISASTVSEKIDTAHDALVSESAARALKLVIGQSVAISGQTLKVRAVFRDYTSERGLIVVDRKLYSELSGDSGIEAIAIYLKDSTSAAQLRAALLKEFPQRAFTFLSNAQLRELIGVIFNQTFSITAIVRFLVMIICAVGFWLLRLQRIWLARREMSTLSVLGVRRREFFEIAAVEGILLALAAGLLGICGGVSLAWILVSTINPLSFGWTLDFEVSIGAILLPLALLIAASLVAALFSVRLEVGRGVLSDE